MYKINTVKIRKKEQNVSYYLKVEIEPIKFLILFQEFTNVLFLFADCLI